MFDYGGTATSTDDLVLPDLLPDHFSNTLSATTTNSKLVAPVETLYTPRWCLPGQNTGIFWPLSARMLMVQNRSHYISRGEHAHSSRIPEWL
jgi:hypothetical protein